MTGRPSSTHPSPSDGTAYDVSGLLEVAEELAVGAGDLVFQGRRGGVDVATVKTSPVDVVTELDTRAEAFVREALAGLRPQDGVLGEEYGLRAGTSGLTWVVDPIDGTVNFLYGIPAYSVSVAVVAGDATRPGAWTPLAGCVYAPAQARTYRAAAGLGSTRTDGISGTTARLTVGPGVPLSHALLGTGFGYRAERRSVQGRVVAALLPQVRDIRRAGCASLDLCAVAAGELDVYYERGLHPWDMAAGLLVVTEAGGVVTGLGGRPPSESMTVAGPASLVTALGALLVDADAERDDQSAE